MNEWFTKHVDTVIVLGAIMGSFLWMNSQINEVNYKISELEKDIAIIKTVLVCHNIMPKEIAKGEK